MLLLVLLNQFSVVVVVKVTVLKLSLMNYSFTCILANNETRDVAFVDCLQCEANL